MEIQTIQQHRKEGLGVMIRRYMQEAWYFDAWYEKLMLVVMGWLAMWKVAGWLW